MKRLLLHAGLAAMTFALGVAAAMLLRPVEDTSLSAPIIPVYEPLFASIASSEVCEVHHAVMSYKCLPPDYLAPHAYFSMARARREERLYPNAHREVGDWCVADGEKGFIALVCPACSAAEVGWIDHPARPVVSSAMCEVHGEVMWYESVPRHYLLPHLAGTLTHLERNRTLYPNAHRKVGDFYMVGDEERFTALVCPACSAAEVGWIDHPTRK